MTTHNERGVALILALFLTAAMSVLAGSLMFLSQTETYSSMNYRMMSQARYAAEAGVQKAGAFLFDATQYSKPGTVATDPLTNYDRTVSPVTYNGQPVVLSAMSGVASNYPIAAVATAFSSAAQGTLIAGGTTVSYSAYAKLLSMQKFDAYGAGAAGTPGIVQTWEITSRGSLGGSRTATVEVVALAEQPVWPANSFGAFATANTCGALTFSGTTDIKSYDSTGMSGGTSPSISDSGGNVGTNGNLSIGGTVDVYGNLYTPRTGVGACSAGAITALSEVGSADVHGTAMPLPATLSYPTPQLPSPTPGTNAISITQANVATACTDLGFSSGCTVTTTGSGASQMTTISITGTGAPIVLPSLSLSSKVTLEIAPTATVTGAQAVNMNSLDLSGGGTIAVKLAANNQSVIVNMSGKNSDGTDMGTVVDFGGNSGGSFSNNSSCTGCSVYDASLLQFVYAGTGAISLRGNSAAAATVYAPNAPVTLNGNSDMYGSILGRTVNNNGNANIYYDRRLSHDFYVEGAQMLGTFTWKSAS
jgi:Tfp pilus assembly protein PilX